MRDGETSIAKMWRNGWLIFGACMLTLGCGRFIMNARHENQQEMAEKAKETQESAEYEANACRVERERTDDDAIAECENAASLFGQDISQNPTKLSYCLESRESRLRGCAKKGL